MNVMRTLASVLALTSLGLVVAGIVAWAGVRLKFGRNMESACRAAGEAAAVCSCLRAEAMERGSVEAMAFSLMGREGPPLWGTAERLRVEESCHAGPSRGLQVIP